IDYPVTLEELARMMETRFDVVLVDVDTDESYALQIITRLAELGPAVMAYSARTDDDLIASCMRAGASDFLPLPAEQGGTAPAPAAPAPRPVPVAPQPAPTPAAAVPQPSTKPLPPVPPPAPRAAAVVPPPETRPVEHKPAPAPAAPMPRS